MFIISLRCKLSELSYHKNLAMEWYMTCLFVLVVLFSVCHHGEAGLTARENTGLDVGFHITATEQCHNATGIYTKLLNVPLIRCVLECATRPKCMAVNHKYNMNTCELLVTDDVTSLLSGYCQYIKKSDIDLGNIPCKNCNMLQACDVIKGECVYKECPEPKIPNARVYGYYNSVGSSIRAVCNRGYKPLNGTVIVICLNTGKWSRTPECVVDNSAVDMDQIDPVSNGHIVYNGTYFKPLATCRKAHILATDEWCMFNCNHTPAFCPQEFCQCDGTSGVNSATGNQ